MRVSRAAAGAAATLALAATAAADGFRIQQGGPSVGNAGAGAAATADDPATVFFNPAGMTQWRQPHCASGANLIEVSLRFRDHGTRGGIGRPTGGASREAGRIAPVPAFFAVLPAGDRTAVGLAVTSPFGLGGDYGKHWPGRYFATRTTLEMVDVAPCAAWRVSERLSFGGGLDVHLLRADLENAIDFGTVVTNAASPELAESLGLAPGRDDGLAVLRGDSMGLGFNASLLWKPDADTRIGLAFRSAVRHDISGDASFDVPRDARRLRLARQFVDTGARTTLTLPETLNLGVVRALGRDTDLVADLDWTRWSRFGALDVRFDNPKQPRLFELQRWRDSVRPSLGVRWRVDDRWTLRAGAAWDQAVAPAKFRRPRAPDAARGTLAVGVGYEVSQSVRIDLDYLHAWFQDAPVDLRDPNSGHLVGAPRMAVDYLSLQVSIGF